MRKCHVKLSFCGSVSACATISHRCAWVRMVACDFVSVWVTACELESVSIP